MRKLDLIWIPTKIVGVVTFSIAILAVLMSTSCATPSDPDHPCQDALVESCLRLQAFECQYFDDEVCETYVQDCLADPVSSHRFEASPLDDLDGDGRAELFLEWPSTMGASGNVAGLLVLSRDGETCGGGTTEMGFVQLEVLDSSHNGLPDLWTFNRGGCAGAEGGAGIYEYDGERYTMVRVDHCPCPTEDIVRAGDYPKSCLLRWGPVDEVEGFFGPVSG